MNTSTPQKPKDRIIDVSAKLFYGHDAHTIGVDRICEVANVSKRTLYKYFPTKDSLVATTVGTLSSAWSEAYTNADSDEPVERIMHVFKLLELNAELEDFYGCHQMNTSIELRDSKSPAADEARHFKSGLYDYFKEQAVLLRVKDPDLLAEQLILLFDGCNAWIIMRRKFPKSVFSTLDLLLKKR
jgi:AcrR family transcriptional regulator